MPESRSVSPCSTVSHSIFLTGVISGYGATRFSTVRDDLLLAESGKKVAHDRDYRGPDDHDEHRWKDKKDEWRNCFDRKLRRLFLCSLTAFRAKRVGRRS